MSSVLQNLVNQPYRHGFVTDIEAETAPKGLSKTSFGSSRTRRTNRTGCSSFA